MILQALLKLAEREGLMSDPDYEPKPVRWLVRVSSEGRLLGIQDTQHTPQAEGKKKPKPVAKTFNVPRQPGRAGTKAPPYFLVDNAKYVFGMTTEDKHFSLEEGEEKSGWFRDSVAECAEATGDPGVQAVLKLLEDIAQHRDAYELPEGCASNDLFAFIYEPDVDQLVSDRPAVRRYWKERRADEEGNSGHSTLCLVSGQPLRSVGLVPQIKKVPGGSTSGSSLVGFNQRAFESYGWRRNENAPISREAAEACATALNRLLHPAWPDPNDPGSTLPVRHLRLSADTAVCFWSAEARGEAFCDVFGDLMEANEEQVKELYRSIWKGERVDVEDPSAFYALTLTGTQGRVIVRDWFESTVGTVAANLAEHFKDLEIVRNTPPPKKGGHRPNMPISTLLQSLAQEGKSDNIPAPHTTQLVNAAMRRTPYPISLLQRALSRHRAEIGKDEWLDLNRRDARAALIKAVLNRRRRAFPDITHYQEVKKAMDPNNPSPGYVLGKLMAVFERMQQLAIGDPNAGVTDRYFSGASASPKTVFVRLYKNARHHARKARDGESAGMAFRLERLIDELSSSFGLSEKAIHPEQNGLPAHLDQEQQGLFVLGYHQMRKWLWMTREEREQWQQDHPDAPRAYNWRGEKYESTTGT